MRNASDNCSSGITSMTGATATAAKKKPCAIATNTPEQANQRRVFALEREHIAPERAEKSASATTAVAAT